jgi:hypothetical protein
MQNMPFDEGEFMTTLRNEFFELLWVNDNSRGCCDEREEEETPRHGEVPSPLGDRTSYSPLARRPHFLQALSETALPSPLGDCTS